MVKRLLFFVGCLAGVVEESTAVSVQYAYTFEHQITALVSQMVKNDVTIDRNIMQALHMTAHTCLTYLEFVLLQRSPEGSVETELIEHLIRMHVLVTAFLCRVQTRHLYVQEDISAVRSFLERIIQVYTTSSAQHELHFAIQKCVHLLAYSKTSVDMVEKNYFR